MAGNVNVINPNDPNINSDMNGGIINATPQYQDMYISAELTAIRRGRTVLDTNNKGTIVSFDKKNSYESDIKINLLGENQNKGGIDNAKFTTNYYDGSGSDNQIQYEGFGITEIDVKINSSYIPQININFIDIRGLAFFNRGNSPYGILFDFPPPIFHLTIKGYYGKATKYQLHLLKYTTEFDSNSGNYNIACQFIGITYAPLTDVLFRHIIQTSLISGKSSSLSETNAGDIDTNNSINSDVIKPPKNTLDMILKIKNLYSSIGEKVNSDEDNIIYEIVKTRIGNIGILFNMLNNVKTNEFLTSGGNLEVFTFKSDESGSNDYGETIKLNGVFDYNKVIKSYGEVTKPNIKERLIIGYLYDNFNNNNNNNTSFSENLSTADIFERENTNKVKETYVDLLIKYKKTLIEKTNDLVNKGFVKSETIPDPIIKNLNGFINDDNPKNNVGYVMLDITEYYYKLYTENSELEKRKTSVVKDLTISINNMVQKSLGMKPTIYNIFKIILDDVDNYFSMLRDVSIKSEKHHNDISYKSLIINDGNYKENVNNKIFSFPLIIKEEKVHCKGVKEVRVAPIKISNRLPKHFPEIDFVEKFIDSFLTYNMFVEQSSLKNNLDIDGNNKWIPFTPADSTLGNLSQLNSPYFGVDSQLQSLNVTNLNRDEQIFEILIKRFNVLTQNTIPYLFFNRKTTEVNENERSLYSINKKVAKDYVELYAKAEAINLVISMTNVEYMGMFNILSTKYSKNIKSFYNEVENSNNLSKYYNDSKPYYNISNGDSLYVDKTENNYIGFSLVNNMDKISVRNGSNLNDNIIGNFLDLYENSFLTKLIFYNSSKKESGYDFTKENLIFVRDISNDNSDAKEYNSSKFIGEISRFQLIKKHFNWAKMNHTPIRMERSDVINGVKEQGNQYFFNKNIMYHKRVGDTYIKDNLQNIVHLWTYMLSRDFFKSGTLLYDTVINNESSNFDTDLSALVILSNFGFTLSTFNYYPNHLNSDVFTTASIIELPQFVVWYMGIIVRASEDSGFREKIYNFYEKGAGSTMDSSGILIMADIYDVKEYLSINDKKLFKSQYELFKSTFFNEISGSLYSMTSRVKKNLDEYDGINAYGRYNEYLNQEESNSYYNDILGSLIKRMGLVCFNDTVFRFAKDNGNDKNESTSKSDYYSLSEMVNNENGELVDFYFKTLFKTINEKIEARKKELIDLENDYRKSTNDEDITTQLYYSFKNINDKWISGLNSNIKGYPFKGNGVNALIDQFAFVDRAMNPIGDTIISPEILTSAINDPHMSIFSVLSQLLSLNGFEFFPLQNFLKFTNNEWEDSFRIDTSGDVNQSPVFICMYIGGTSSYPTGIGYHNEFKDDGIVDLRNPGVTDFSGCDGNSSNRDDSDVDKGSRDVYSEVRAFDVNFGEQNQNMFSSMKIESKEYPETNESIQILSQLAGDNKENSPIPKAQNLYSLYENRAYKATVSGLGNVMLQPTQYFQLNNVPLFNGAYVILSVEHKIVPNKMTTTFSGTKILKYPMPRVLNSSAIVGYEGGSSTETNSDTMSKDNVTKSRGAADNPNESKHNAMYNFNVKIDE